MLIVLCFLAISSKCLGQKVQDWFYKASAKYYHLIAPSLPIFGFSVDLIITVQVVPNIRWLWSLSIMIRCYDGHKLGLSADQPNFNKLFVFCGKMPQSLSKPIGKRSIVNRGLPVCTKQTSNEHIV